MGFFVKLHIRGPFLIIVRPQNNRKNSHFAALILALMTDRGKRRLP